MKGVKNLYKQWSVQQAQPFVHGLKGRKPRAVESAYLDA